MIKMMAKGTKNGSEVTVLVFGLSYRNIDLLQKGRPIRVRGEDINMPGVEVCIFAGEDERTMMAEMDKFIGPDTRVNISPKLKD